MLHGAVTRSTACTVQQEEANYPRQHTLALVSLQPQSQHSQSLTAFKRGRMGLKELLRGPSHYGARDTNEHRWPVINKDLREYTGDTSLEEHSMQLSET